MLARGVSPFSAVQQHGISHPITSDYTAVTIASKEPASETYPAKPCSAARAVCWSAMPDHLVERILAHVQEDGDQDWPSRASMFSAAGVCTTWRRLARPVFWDKPWEHEDVICHPRQLFGVSPKPVPHTLLKCFVRRDTLGGHWGPTRFCLYLGGDHVGTEPKLLLAAVHTSRWGCALFLNAACKGEPVAFVSANLFGTAYGICPVGIEGLVGAEAEAPPPPSLGEVQYKTRIKGFMRPRRMTVELPHPSEMTCFDVERQREARGCRMEAMASAALDGDVPDVSGGWVSKSALAFRRCIARAGLAAKHPSVTMTRNPSGVLDTSEGSGPSNAGGSGVGLRHALAGVVSPEPMQTAASTASLISAASLAPPGAAKLRPMHLKNKSPHWNEALRCWCLNFKGRVRLASVKNFQLVCMNREITAALNAAAAAADCPANIRTGKSVVMQFGKVEAETYILDFNPMVLSVAQAFAIALSTFDSKLLI